jgi:hypothetical protein
MDSETTVWEEPHTQSRSLKLKCQLLNKEKTHYGKSRSIETITLMRANHPHTKRVYQYDLDRITLISQYDSIRC